MNRLLCFALIAMPLCSAVERTDSTPPGDLILWVPHTMTTSDWIWGPGGEQRSPAPPFRFIRENMGGTNPKVDVRDAAGRKWIVKFGGEVHTDVFASRLLYATGYFAE